MSYPAFGSAWYAAIANPQSAEDWELRRVVAVCASLDPDTLRSIVKWAARSLEGLLALVAIIRKLRPRRGAYLDSPMVAAAALPDRTPEELGLVAAAMVGLIQPALVDAMSRRGWQRAARLMTIGDDTHSAESLLERTKRIDTLGETGFRDANAGGDALASYLSGLRSEYGYTSDDRVLRTLQQGGAFLADIGFTGVPVHYIISRLTDADTETREAVLKDLRLSLAGAFKNEEVEAAIAVAASVFSPGGHVPSLKDRIVTGYRLAKDAVW